MIPLMALSLLQLVRGYSCSTVHSKNWNRYWDVHLLQSQVTVMCQGVLRSPQAKHSDARAPV